MIKLFSLIFNLYPEGQEEMVTRVPRFTIQNHQLRHIRYRNS